MSTAFLRTIRSLSTDGKSGRTVALLAAVVLLALWLSWFFLGRVPVYEVSRTARLEVSGRVRPVACLVNSQVVESNLELGRSVKQGDLLVQLDDHSPQLAVGEGRARLEELNAQLEAIDKQITAARQAIEAAQLAVVAGCEEYDARIVEARVRAQDAKLRLDQVNKLTSQNVASQDELRHAQLESQARHAVLEVARAARRRFELDQQVKHDDRRTQLGELLVDRAQITGQRDVQRATLERLNNDVAQCRILAPVSGRIGQVEDLPAGAAVEAGQVFAVVVPTRVPRVVASFRTDVIGRIRPGQPAQVRLDGFPWIQYGSIHATVTKIASEPQGGLVRVEMDLEGQPSVTVPVEHGLPGVGHVLVERISPAVLVLRTTGWFLRSRQNE